MMMNETKSIGGCLDNIHAFLSVLAEVLEHDESDAARYHLVQLARRDLDYLIENLPPSQRSATGFVPAD